MSNDWGKIGCQFIGVAWLIGAVFTKDPEKRTGRGVLAIGYFMLAAV